MCVSIFFNWTVYHTFDILVWLQYSKIHAYNVDVSLTLYTYARPVTRNDVTNKSVPNHAGPPDHLISCDEVPHDKSRQPNKWDDSTRSSISMHQHASAKLAGGSPTIDPTWRSGLQYHFETASTVDADILQDAKLVKAVKTYLLSIVKCKKARFK